MLISRGLRPVFVLALLFCAFLPAAVYAQEASQIAPVSDDGAALLDDHGRLKPVEDEYVEMSVENLSKMYWAVAMLSFDDPKNIDNYLMINECDMYRKFYHNDFEWQEIRRVTTDYIRGNLGTFSTKFEVIMPIYLDRYDLNIGKFLIQPDSQFNNVVRLETGYSRTYLNVCGEEGAIPNYPKNIVLNFNLPFTLTDIPVKPEVAEFYMQESMRQYAKLPPDKRLKFYERVAFVRLKVTMLQFKDFVRTGTGPVKAAIFARVDGYDIFADQDKRLLMYSQDSDNRQIKRRRLQRACEDDGVELPPDDAGALLQPTKTEN